MIQRIQSIYLLIVFLLTALLFFIPLYTNITTNAENGTHEFQYTSCTSNLIYLVMNSVSGILTIITILQYKNRVLQVRLCNLNMFVTCILTGTIFYFADHSNDALVSKVRYEFGTYIPLFQLLLIFLAMRAIRKDEALVRSADRLR
jgi:hypothetical protein